MTRVVAVLIAATVIAGCSGGADDATSATSTTTATSTTAPVPAETVTTEAADESTPTSSTVSPTTSPATTPTTVSPGDEAPDGAGTATGALDDADIQIETDDGTIQIGVAEVPDGVSDSFPIPADLDVQLSSSTDTDFGFSGVSAMSIADLATFYEAGLSDAGYEITDRQEIDDVLAVYTFERGDESGQVAISSAPGGAGSSVLVTIGDGTSRTEDSLDG